MFFVSVLCLFLCVCCMRWMCLCVCCMCLCVLSVSLCVWMVSDCVCMCVCLFSLYLLNNTESITQGRNLWQSCTRGCLWLQLIPTGPDDKHHCLLTNIHKWLLSTFIVDFRRWLSTSVCISAFSKWYTYFLWVRGMEEYIISNYTYAGA